MTESIFICVPGEPVGKQSVRVSMAGGFARKYMPTKTRDYEQACHDEAVATMQGRPLFEGPLALKLQIIRSVPKSWSKKKREQALLGMIAPINKPDSSNVLKAVEDGFTGAVWVDDAQVVDHHITKRYGEEPCIVAIVTPLDLAAPPD